MHSVFLRGGCILPGRLEPMVEAVGDNWNVVREIAAPGFDTMIRQAGWHFMWIQGPCCRSGMGPTQEEATHRALVRALKGILRRFNCAELNAIEVRKYLGFHVAKVTLQPRQIQEHSSLEMPAEMPQRAVFAR